MRSFCFMLYKSMNQETETQITYLYEIKEPWTDPQGVVHQPKDLCRELIAGGIFHPQLEPMQGILQTQPTRKNPAYIVPDELVKVTKITTVRVTTETILKEEIKK